MPLDFDHEPTLVEVQTILFISANIWRFPYGKSHCDPLCKMDDLEVPLFWETSI